MKNGSVNGDSTGASGCFLEISERPRYRWINVTGPCQIVENRRNSTSHVEKPRMALFANQ
jgi:hypothetical protein